MLARSRNTLLCTLFLLVLAASIYGPYILHGGFAWDDWENAADAATPSNRALAPFNLREALYEPGLALLLPLPHLLFGSQPAWHLTLAVALGVAMSTSLFIFLRALNFPTVAAVVVAALTLVFPWSDSLHLWATAGINQMAAVFYLLGSAVALRRLARKPAANAPHARNHIAVALYIASMLTYPITVVLVGCSTLLYRCVAGWRVAWQHGRRDLVCAAVIAIFQWIATTKPVLPVSAQIQHLFTIVDQWITLLTKALTPVGEIDRVVVITLLAGLAATTLIAIQLNARGIRLKRWATTSVIAAGWALLAYLVFAPGEAKYVPLAPGLYNRVGLLAGPAVAVFVFSIAMVISELLLGKTRPLKVDRTRVRLGRRALLKPNSHQAKLHLVTPFACLLGGVIFVGWLTQVNGHIRQWQTAAIESRAVLSSVKDRLPETTAGTVVFTTNHRTHIASGIPVFASAFDLHSAVKVNRKLRAVHAYPLVTPLNCGEKSASSAIAQNDLTEIHYGKLFVIDVTNGRVERVADRRSCVRIRSTSSLASPSSYPRSR